MVKIWERPAPAPDPEEPVSTPVEALEPVEEAQGPAVEEPTEDELDQGRKWVYWQG